MLTPQDEAGLKRDEERAKRHHEAMEKHLNDVIVGLQNEKFLIEHPEILDKRRAA